MFDVERMDEESAAGDGGGRAVDWRAVDRELRRIAKRRARLDAEEARWLLAARRAEVHRQVGCGTFAEYVERVLGHGPRACAERLRIAEALTELPAIEEALASGGLLYSAVRELTRVATPATEAAWVEAATDKTVREVEELVSGHEPGDLPDDPPDPDLRPHMLRFEISPEEYALYREAELRIRAEAGRMVSDGEMIGAMSRAVLAPVGAADETNTPPYQIALTVCEKCDRTWQDGAGRAIEVGPELAAIARCDAQELGRVDGNTRQRATRTIAPGLRRQVIRRDHGRCIVPGCRASRWIEVHHIHERSKGGPDEAHNMGCVCSSHHAALHRGLLSITGEPNARHFWNADGSPWGAAPIAPIAPTRAPSSLLADARSALRNLGFTAAESATAVERAVTHAGAHAPLEALLRESLRACRPPP